MIHRHMFWTLAIIVIIIAGWYAFEGSWDRQLFRPLPGMTCQNLDAAEAKTWLQNHPETQVLDVRSAREFAGGAVPGAVNISIGDADFDAKVSALVTSKPVLVYCAGGFRSRKAVAKLKALGFENIQHIHRGYMSWKPDTRR